MSRVVITGMGAITPVGNTLTDTWAAIKASVCGIDEITHFDPIDHKVKLAAEVKGFDPTTVLSKQEVRKLDRFSQFAIVCADAAYQDAGLTDEIDRTRIGVMVSSGIGGIKTIEETVNKLTEAGPNRISPHFIPKVLTNLAAGNVAIHLGAKGICHTIVTACAASTDAVGAAFRHIQGGFSDVVIAGGAEASITPVGIAGFSIIRATSESTDKTRASIPFDKERHGFVMGEGAGMLVLENLDHALARGAKIYGEVIGYGATCDAFHVTAPSETGEGAIRAMQEAIQTAGIKPEDIDYINAHGTSTPLNDKTETQAVKTVFGDHAYQLAMSSTKGATGHLLGATGAIEAILSVKALEEGFLPPTLNHQVADPACDLDIVANVGRSQDIMYAMSNSLGFGGHNASVVFKKWTGEA
ncbi:MAG: beta-ketoacyl-ACP synthase II [Defluviitaleaceae bacterium]|nr:beta-ketoacyl-ACP synthase II [Defluviitaleaceae bacterium]